MSLMDTLKKNQSTVAFSEPSIVFFAILFAIMGLIFRDSLGFTRLLAAIGIGLVVAGTAYISVEGSELLRFSVAFISLVALPLLSYGSVIRWIGVPIFTQRENPGLLACLLPTNRVAVEIDESD